MNTWHYLVGSTTMTDLTQGTVQAIDWCGALNEVTKYIKDSGFDPNEIYIWDDDA